VVGAFVVIAAVAVAGCASSSTSAGDQSAGGGATSSAAPGTSAAGDSGATSEASPAGSGDSSAPAGDLPTINIVSFQAPSLGAFLPAVIEANGLDKKHGINMKITYATTDNYNTEFAAGHYDVGVSAALLSEALRTERGVGVTYLFNLFDFWGTVVTSNPAVKTLADLQGKTLAAASATTNYAMFQWFAKQENVDLTKIKVENQSTPGLSTMALTGRTDAVELWEPAYSTLVAKKPDIRTINLDMAKWQAKFGTGDIPYLGVAAQLDWAQAHPDLVQKMYDTYKEAAEWTTANPEEAGKIIAATIPSGNPAVITDLIKSNDRLQMHVVPASQVQSGIKAVFEAGLDSGYLKKEPPQSVIYDGLK
jgi:ABC-type nitrate/sulfonate/bicarbonate transport system substrate-binding protein